MKTYREENTKNIAKEKYVKWLAETKKNVINMAVGNGTVYRSVAVTDVQSNKSHLPAGFTCLAAWQTEDQ